MNQELKDLYKGQDLVGDIKRRRLELVGHVWRMERDRAIKRILEEERWLDGVEDLRQLKVKRWRQKALNREEWAVVIKEAKILRGL